MVHKNIFGVWVSNGLELPFFVRRSNWSEFSLFCVVSVFPKVTKGGLFGIAYGYYLNLGGDDRPDGNLEERSCAGCYQWELVMPSE